MIGIATITGFFAKKLVPWKLIGVGLAALAILATVSGGFLYINNLQNNLVESQRELATQRLKTEFEKARAAAIVFDHDTQVERLQKLEGQKMDIENEAAALRKTIEDINLEEDLNSEDHVKADAAIARLNARNTELNRMQSHESGHREVRPGKAAGTKAGKAPAASAFKRAIQALRKDGVHQPD